MKTILLSAVCFLFAMHSADAYTANTRLQIRAYDNSPIIITLDGVDYGAYNSRQSLDNLAPGYHDLQVTALVADPYNTENSREQVIYTGSINIDNGYALDMVVNPNNQMQVASESPLYTTVCYAPPRPVVIYNTMWHTGYCAPVIRYTHNYHYAPTAYCAPVPRHAPVYNYSPRGSQEYHHDGGGYHDNGHHDGGGYQNNGHHDGGNRGPAPAPRLNNRLRN